MSRKVATADNLLTFERFCAGLKICLLRNHELRSDKESNVRHFQPSNGPFHPLTSQDSPSEAELDSHSQRVSQLRKQRFASSQSPLLSPPPPAGAGPGGPPKPPRTSYSLATDNRKLGDGGAASDGDIERVNSNNNLGRKQPKRRESHSRRHTLQNGIDYGLVRSLVF